MILNFWTIFLTLPVCFLLISIIYYLQLWQIKLKFRNSTMPFHFPIIGCGHLFIGKNFFRVLLGVYYKCNTNIIVRIGLKTTYVTKEVNEIRKILTDPNCLNKTSTYSLLKAAFGDALLLAPVEKWKYNRKCLAKCFNQTLLDTFVPLYYQKSNTLVEVLKKEKIENLFDKMERLTFDSFCVTAIGVDLHLQTTGDLKIIELFAKGQELALERFVRPWEQVVLLYWLTSRGKLFFNIVDELKKIMLGIVQEKRKLFDEAKTESFERIPKLKTVIDCMLELQDEGYFDEKHLLDEAFLMIGAATDTSAATMAFVFGLLGMHQDIQQRVYEEILEVVGVDRSIEAEHLPRLKYTERVINESMRIFPATPLFGRETSGKIDLGSVKLEDKTDIIIFAFAMHRDESIYPNPLKFDPDRFLPEEVAKRPAGSFIPFSAGPRNCIGLRYAYMIMKTTVANVVRNFKIDTEQKTVEEIELVSSIVMTSPNLKCSFTPRH